MKINIGDIILIPFPFTDLSSQKTRPALVIYREETGEDLIILAITSKKEGKSRFLIQNKNLAKGELPIDSHIRINKVATLNKNLVKKGVATLNESILHEVLIRFKQQF